ncbi:MAG: 2-C-methyl-D-erythritol 4-phosphate cytidylyltransferase [Planctomycetota bacterium]
MSVSILVLAAGRGTRLGGDVPKAFVPVGGEAILHRSVRRLAEVFGAQGGWEMVLAVHPDDRALHLEPLLPGLEALGLTRVVDGGATRQESMARALAASSGDRELVLVHDAARPFFPIAAVREAAEQARTVGAAVLAVPVPDTVKQVDDGRRVVATIDRNGLWLAQTPQVIRRDLLEHALAAAREDNAAETDDVALLERLGQPVVVVPGSATNIKITSQADLELAEALVLREREHTP